MKLFILFLLILVALVYSEVANSEGEEQTHIREKRQYYGGYDYGGDDFWYVGRIVGMIAGIILLLFCCCLPCICIVGIWFAGWFGLRQRNAAKKAPGQATNPPPPITTIQQPAPILSSTTQVPYDTPGNANYIVPPVRSRYPVVVESSPADVSRVAMPDGQVVYSAEDRYYTSSTAPAPAHRPDVYTTTNRY